MIYTRIRQMRQHFVAVIWDRKITQRFPEMKELKQLVRDIIVPERSLGHSDRKSANQQKQEAPAAVEECLTCPKD
ncbi:unnamed protein product [Mucor fragilis]